MSYESDGIPVVLGVKALFNSDFEEFGENLFVERAKNFAEGGVGLDLDDIIEIQLESCFLEG